MRPIKNIGKSIVCTLLEKQVKRLRKRNAFVVVAVVGSIGKTSTKLAIARMLSVDQRVVYQSGNYNDRVTVPLVLFGQPEPSLLNVFAWLKILLANERQLRQPYKYDVAVLELGVDGPGQMRRFAYLQPDLLVVTALSPEHMEYFGTLDAVAKEELTALSFSKRVLMNVDDIPAQYLPSQGYYSYGFTPTAAYHIMSHSQEGLARQRLLCAIPDGSLDITTILLGVQGAKIALAAAAIGHLLGRPIESIQKGLMQLPAVPGRMQILPGVQHSILIDDTYNASPVAVKAALHVLYGTPAPQRIAILGNMNEMGDGSPQMHTEVGNYCDASKLDLVVTIGPDANAFLAPAATARGCKVQQFANPREAGEFVKSQLKDGAIVLAKGSQNGVFAEEAVKVLLANPADASKLVRQSDDWMRRKSHLLHA